MTQYATYGGNSLDDMLAGADDIRQYVGKSALHPIDQLTTLLMHRIGTKTWTIKIRANRQPCELSGLRKQSD